MNRGLSVHCVVSAGVTSANYHEHGDHREASGATGVNVRAPAYKLLPRARL